MCIRKSEDRRLELESSKHLMVQVPAKDAQSLYLRAFHKCLLLGIG